MLRNCLALVLLECIHVVSYGGFEWQTSRLLIATGDKFDRSHPLTSSRSSIDGCTAAAFHRDEICCGKQDARYQPNRIWGSGSRLAAASNDRGVGEPQGLEGQLEGHP